MLKQVLTLLAMAVFAVGIASAKTHSIRIHTESQIAGQDLSPGSYKVNVEGEKVTITNGKQTVESTVKVEEASEKYSRDSVRYIEVDGKMKVREIRLGGTNTRLVFSPTSPTSAQ